NRAPGEEDAAERDESDDERNRRDVARHGRQNLRNAPPLLIGHDGSLHHGTVSVDPVRLRLTLPSVVAASGPGAADEPSLLVVDNDGAPGQPGAEGTGRQRLAEVATEIREGPRSG